MNTIAVTVISILTIVNTVPVIRQPGRLPMPVALQEKWGHLMHDDPPEVRSRIKGGSTVRSGGRPYQIGLFRSGSLTCGGSFIGTNKVLTAANCVSGYEENPTPFTVAYNSLKSNGGTTLGVSRIIRHAQYSSTTIDYDIALLTLTESFEPGTNAAIVSLAEADTDPAEGTPLIVSGWGLTAAGGSISQNLLQAKLNVVSRTECKKKYEHFNSITDRMICAHSRTQSACNGDSGGPLTNGGILVGVVSFGSSSCQLKGLPNVFASVGSLRQWIDDNTV